MLESTGWRPLPFYVASTRTRRLYYVQTLVTARAAGAPDPQLDLHTDTSHTPVRVEIWAFPRRSPFLPWTGFDLLSWKPFASRRADWMARIVDRLDRWNLMKQQWRPAGRRRPIDP